MRLPLALSLALLVVAASPAAAERPRRVISEDARVDECRTDPVTLTQHCVIVQVTRTTLSDGAENTLVFFSATENGVEKPVFPNPFFSIDSQAFVMNWDGTSAILNFTSPPSEDGQPGQTVEVVWGATDDFSSRSFSIEVVKEKTAEGFTKSRLTEREQQLSARATGVVGPVTFNTGPPTEGEEDFSLASLTVRKEVTRIRLFEDEPDSPDIAE